MSSATVPDGEAVREGETNVRLRADDPDRVTNVLTFDLEHWHSATLLADHVTDPVDRVEDSVSRVLDILADHDVSATFFTVGAVAREYPSVVGRIADAGHEVASHGDTHTPLYDLDPEGFETELERAQAAIERAAGVRPRGFRAPNFSLATRTSWAVRVLRETGYEYDASVFPVRTPMYGLANAPVSPYRIRAESLAGPAESAEMSDLLELPAAIFHPRVRIPVAGGFYARALPGRLLARGVRNLNARGVPATLYFHPWEFNPDVPVNGLDWHRRVVSFHGIESLAKKVRRLLEQFRFDTASSLVRKHDRRYEGVVDR
jgi:polysaccharide deacetylase family protein (PEP-CTERM system associated)